MIPFGTRIHFHTNSHEPTIDEKIERLLVILAQHGDIHPTDIPEIMRAIKELVYS